MRPPTRVITCSLDRCGFPQVEKAAKAASRTEAALKEEKSTLEFQIQEAEVKLAEAISALAERTASETALKQEMEAGNKYQQEIEGEWSN